MEYITDKNGTKRSGAHWARTEKVMEMGITYTMLRKRKSKEWTDEEILNIPQGTNRARYWKSKILKTIPCVGSPKTLGEWSNAYGKPWKEIVNELKKGSSEKDAILN
jgi:hypothetical protein